MCKMDVLDTGSKMVKGLFGCYFTLFAFYSLWPTNSMKFTLNYNKYTVISSNFKKNCFGGFQKVTLF